MTFEHVYAAFVIAALAPLAFLLRRRKRKQ